MKLTEKAITEARARLSHGEYLRISVDGGGCSGYQLALTKTAKRNSGDITLEKVAVIDQMSLTILEGAELDYEASPFSQTFKLKPPPGTQSCGCGSSFTRPEENS